MLQLLVFILFLPVLIPIFIIGAVFAFQAALLIFAYAMILIGAIVDIVKGN